jgi:Putative binding domain, N-terminal
VSGSVPAWLTITSGTSGTGNGTVKFSLSANTSLVTRSANLTIGGQPFTLTQRGNITAAKIVSPAPGSTLQSRTVTFQWNAGTGTTGTYQLTVGTTGPGSSDVTTTAVTGTSVTIQNTPNNSALLYVRLYSVDASSVRDWLYNDYTFTEPGSFKVIPLVAH